MHDYICSIKKYVNISSDKKQIKTYKLLKLDLFFIFALSQYQTTLAKMQFWHHQTYKTSLMKFGLQFECNCLLGHLLLAIVVVVDYFQNCSPHLSIIHTFKTIHLLDYMILLSFFAIVTTIAILYYLLDVSLINAYNLLQVCNSCINQKSHLTSMQYNYTACSNIKIFFCVL